MADVYCIVNQTIRLSEPTREIHLTTPLAYSNSQAHAMQVTVVNDTGGPADLSNVGVTGHFRKANGDTVTPINGTVSGNVARVILPASCYVTPGRFTFTLDLSVTGDYNRTALWVEGMVKRNTSSNIIDPGTPVSNIEQAISRANAAAQAAETAAEEAQGVADNAVRYDTSQSLTETQMAQARSNIRAALVEYTDGDTGFIIHNAYITEETAVEEPAGSETEWPSTEEPVPENP